MAKRLNIGVAGLGRIGWRQHCLNLAKHPAFRLTAVSDTEEDRRTEAETTLGCASYADFYAMAAEAKLDAVVIATPTHLHKPMALAALRAGLHVLLEKPMALDLAESRAIAAAARKHKRVLTVYQPRRLAALFRQVLQIVQSGRIGSVVKAQAALFSYARRNDWQSLQRYGGGMLNNYGAHAIDLVLQLAGYDVSEVHCHLQRIASLGDTDDAVTLMLRTRRGVVGVVDINQASVISPYYLLVWGTCGAIRCHKDMIHLSYFDPTRLPEKRVDDRLASANRSYPSDNLRVVEKTIAVAERRRVNVYTDFAEAIRTGRPPIVTPEESLAVMDVIERARKSAGRIAAMKG